MDSNPDVGKDVCTLWVLCVVRYRFLRRADHPSRGVLRNVVCLIVIAKPHKGRAWQGIGSKIHRNKSTETKFSSPCTQQPTKYPHLEPHETRQVLKFYSYKFHSVVCSVHIYQTTVYKLIQRYAHVTVKKFLYGQTTFEQISVVSLMVIVIRKVQLYAPQHRYSKPSCHAHRHSLRPHELTDVQHSWSCTELWKWSE